MTAKRTLLPGLWLAGAILIIVSATPAGALPPCDACTCSYSCAAQCWDGPELITCGEWGVCVSSSSCTGACSCGVDIYGGTGNDSLNGTAANNCIYGYGGDDTIHGNDGNDKLYGSSGGDSLYGDNGNDCLYGESGDDTLVGGNGTDHLDGGSGHDTCSSGETYVSCGD